MRIIEVFCDHKSARSKGEWGIENNGGDGEQEIDDNEGEDEAFDDNSDEDYEIEHFTANNDYCRDDIQLEQNVDVGINENEENVGERSSVVVALTKRKRSWEKAGKKNVLLMI